MGIVELIEVKYKFKIMQILMSLQIDSQYAN